MQPVSARRRKCFLCYSMLLQLAGRNGFVYSSQILINNSASAEVEMPHFRIPHLPFGQTDVRSACAQFAAWIIAIELVVERCAGEECGISIFLCLRPSARVDSPAVANNERDWPGHDELCRRLRTTTRAFM